MNIYVFLGGTHPASEHVRKADMCSNLMFPNTYKMHHHVIRPMLLAQFQQQM